MKLALEQILIDIRLGTVLDVDITEPGIRLNLSTVHVPSSPLLVTPDGDRGKTYALPMLLVQIDPDRPKRKRRFCVLDMRIVIDLDAFGVHDLEYVGMITNPNNGMALVIYEVPSDQIATMDAVHDARRVEDAAKVVQEQPTS